jgi:hypothetical protein
MFSLYTGLREQYVNTVVSRDLPGFPHELFQSTIQRGIDALTGMACSECYFDYTVEDFLKRYERVFDTAINDVFEPLPTLDQTDQSLLKTLGALSLQRSFFSRFHTGFVFSGFGSKQLFPALKSYRFDGMVFGRLKRLHQEVVAIDANNIRARIVPFAQREMVDRFLFGIDRRHEITIVDNVRQNLNTLSTSIIDSLPGIRRATRRRLRENLRRSIETVLADLRDTTIQELKDESAGETDDAVMFMAKSDLANFAEALVNITSVKRRVSLETESVGGPIDVAVVSRDDGFVWSNESIILIRP